MFLMFTLLLGGMAGQALFTSQKAQLVSTMMVHGVIGALLSLGIAALVNLVLVQISLSAFAAFVSGLALIFLGELQLHCVLLLIRMIATGGSLFWQLIQHHFGSVSHLQRSVPAFVGTELAILWAPSRISCC